MMDLVVAMAPFVDEDTMSKTFELVRPYLEVGVNTMYVCPKFLIQIYSCTQVYFLLIVSVCIC